MYFFKNFKKIDYAFIDTPNDVKQVTNILTSFFLRKLTFNKSLIFQKYIVKESDIIEGLSEELYKTPLYYWSFLLINNIVNPYTEWMMVDETIQKYTEKKYKLGKQVKLKDGTIKTVLLSEGTNGIHHFYNNMLNKVCDDYDNDRYRLKYVNEGPNSIDSNIRPITNLAYEKQLNSDRMGISVISPRQISKFEESLNKMLTGTVTKGKV